MTFDMWRIGYRAVVAAAAIACAVYVWRRGAWGWWHRSYAAGTVTVIAVYRALVAALPWLPISWQPLFVSGDIAAMMWLLTVMAFAVLARSWMPRL